MFRNNMLAVFATAAMLALPLSAATAQPGPPPLPPPTGPVMPLEYAAKFVCGTNTAPGASTTLVAFGQYYTAVNIHNPNRENVITYKVAIAPQGKPGPMTGFQPPMQLRYDEALDVDCRLIRARAQQAGIGLPGSVFFTGFLVVQSRAELDVVAVYTASPVATNQVASIHTERVPVRRLRD
jgi:hypothetical protein